MQQFHLLDVNMNAEEIMQYMTDAAEAIRRLHAENKESKERLEDLWQLYTKQLDINEQQQNKIDKMRDDIVSLTDDLFAERRECIKLEDEIKKLKDKLLDEQWKNADADIR
jgi:hypothetical protein